MQEVTTPTTEDETCEALGYQTANVCVPVTIKPYATAGSTTTKCCGKPCVTPGICGCRGTRNGTCIFTISQCINVSVPVNYGAKATIGDTYVKSFGASDDDICLESSDLEEDE